METFEDKFNHIMTYHAHGDLTKLMNSIQSNGVKRDIELSIRTILEKHNVDLDGISKVIEEEDYKQYRENSDDVKGLGRMAKNGNRYAMVELGYRLCDSLDKVEVQEGIDMLLKTRELGVHNSNVYCGLAMGYNKLGLSVKEKEIITTGIKEHNIETYRYADMLRSKDPDKAVEYLLMSSSETKYTVAGHYCETTGNIEKAIEIYEKYFDVCKSDPDVCNVGARLVGCYIETKDNKKALDFVFTHMFQKEISTLYFNNKEGLHKLSDDRPLTNIALGLAYEYGIGCTADTFRAREFYIRGGARVFISDIVCMSLLPIISPVYRTLF